MNTEIIVHPKLQHYGLTTANLDVMIDWYRKVLGMTVNHRASLPPMAQGRAPFSSFAFVGNDEVHHRIVFFETPDAMVDPDKLRHVRVQHVAFEYQTLDDLLGTYARLKGLGILPVMAVDEGLQMAIYYTDPEQNSVELNVNNYGNEWTATEHMRSAPPIGERPRRSQIDLDKMIAARKAGASPWELHERASARQFAPDKPYDPRSLT
jgi:catechol 2,3-dioxygenase-like lactoylglutathione lyase family enzyme